MAKSRPFSFYLLKQGETPSSTLRETANISEPINAAHLPQRSELRLGRTVGGRPWWRDYFGIEERLFQQASSAVLFLPNGDRWLAITFGSAFHSLNQDALEHDFGLRVTLNCVQPDNLRSTDTVEPSGSRRRRTQIPIAADLTSFDFDTDNSILKRLTGAVRNEYKAFFKNITGSTNVKLTSTVLPEELPSLAEKLVEIYQSKQFEQHFPNIHNIVPVRDPSTLETLNASLLRAINSRAENVSLAIPDILDFDRVADVKYKGLRYKTSGNNVDINDYFNALEKFFPNQEIRLESIDSLKKQRLELVGENAEITNSNSIWSSLVFDTTIEHQKGTFHLNEGNWYQVDEKFAGELTSDLDKYWKESDLPPFTQGKEGDYNANVPSHCKNICCLDGENISPRGQTRIEPCDLGDLGDGGLKLLHVKRSTRSASLSHLFSQATTSAELLIFENDAREKLVQLIEEKTDAEHSNASKTHLENRTFRVGYVIITKKPPSDKSSNLPLFSRINLRRSLRDLDARGCEPIFEFVNQNK